ncbi:MAG: O-antigen ligase family protein [Micavibrio sp.]
MLNKLISLGKQSPSALVYALPALLLCLCLQIQISLFKTDDYLGLRINLADLLLPVLGILVFIRLLMRRDNWPQWRVPYTYLWLAGLTALMTVAVINGYHTTGEWQIWALVNKYVGWFVLLAYFALGGWIAGQKDWDWQPFVIKALCGFWIVCLLGFCIWMIYLDLQDNSDKIYRNYPLSGFMGNRNAYALLSCTALAFATTFVVRHPLPHYSTLLKIIWVLVPFYYIVNGSRAGLITLAVVILAFCALHFKFSFKHIILPLLFGSLMAFAFFASHKSYIFDLTHEQIVHTGQIAQLDSITTDEAEEKLSYVGDRVRMTTYTDAIALWKRHPLIGGGLGSFRAYQNETGSTYNDIIDFTALWLLAETGIIGLSAFSIFFLLALWQVFKRVKSQNDPHGFYMGLLMTMIIFAIMSLAHELLYTRFLWFLMGLGLAVNNPIPQRD